MQKTILVKNLKDWDLVVDELLSLAKPEGRATIVALSGELGAGKTTLVQTLAKQLGVSEVVTSPTFAIMKGYALNSVTGFINLVHMDAYRIEDLNELAPLRFTEILNTPATILCLEWPEKIASALPDGVIYLSITHQSGEEREVVIRA